MARSSPPRFRFTSSHSGLYLQGRGWSAQFDRGRFATDDLPTALGIARRAEQHPEYGISLVRGSDKPADQPPPAPAEGGEGS